MHYTKFLKELVALSVVSILLLVANVEADYNCFGILQVLMLAMEMGNKVNAQTREVTRIAGNGIAGYSGDNGPAVNSQLNSPFGIVYYKNEVYFADTNNHRIRKIDSNGNITTIVGKGSAGFSGDNGMASECTLNGPIDITINSNGDIYILDGNNYRIRKVSTGGIITTVVGNGLSTGSGDDGLATSASLHSITSAIRTLDDGTIFILDGNKIRKVNSTGYITTIAGTETGSFNGDNILATVANLNRPTDLLYIPTNEFMLSDTDNHRLRMILRNGTIITIGGNGVSGFSGDYGDATLGMVASPGCIIGTGTGMLFTDPTNKMVRKTTKIKYSAPYCFGLAATDSNVCSGKGLCVATDTCQCSSTLTGINGASCNGTGTTNPISESPKVHYSFMILGLVFILTLLF